MRLRRLTWIAALLVMSLLLVVACGGEGDGDDPGMLPDSGIEAPGGDTDSQPLPGGVGNGDEQPGNDGADGGPDDSDDDGEPGGEN